ncbi:M48 family metallopeptidase [soil metagenome]
MKRVAEESSRSERPCVGANRSFSQPTLRAMPMLPATLLFSFMLVASLAVKLWLSTRQMRHVATHRNAVPSAFEGTVSLHAHHKAADYTLAKGRFGLISTAVGTATVLAWTLLGGLDALNAFVRDSVQPRWGSMAYQLVLIGAFAIISALIDLPGDLYNTFRLEQRHGFNRMTWAMYFTDMLKSTVIALVIGTPIAALVLWIMGSAGGMWWVYAWVAWMALNLLLLVLYPTIIAPLFNKFRPLDDDTLRQRVQTLMTRCGFESKGLFVMDGSKRSAHANAYFTGFGASKRVVFFDTLLAKLSPQEVEAVLAHELGHFKLNHVIKRIGSMFLTSLVALALLGWLSRQTPFYTSLGVQPSMAAPNDALALLLFMLVLPIFTFFGAPLFARMSRRHEFEADAYAAQQSSGRDLANALLKLHEDNASTLTPDPVYVRFYYSHPPASERLAALANQ